MASESILNPTDRLKRDADGLYVIDPRSDQAELDRLRVRAARGLELTPRQAWQMSTRLMLQAPRGLTAKQIKNVAADLDRRIRGLPAGAFMALDALRLLADGGNDLAEVMFEMETERLGLTTPLRSFPR